ncbi:hypothetical protein LIP72_09150 [Mediterraneibacter faecis]|jgi:hypothetical protein|uniref:hypothetical protein n=1 Tax=Mediterraneibacter faecis TaxID=592978 RepID=UPI001D007C45|nr:hypothetical protein [Mediterraneibacter faecis]MCB5569519.1 hypothetical protein [Mediterraneibacter faecis]MCB5574327.1 hypothetical protein [Mediterraneibacter faecis]MCB5740617.1 hypothetical protein [Mediterraneibacter faecis]MCB5752070.1 hypothetical protein [Mediterraneibacter faecis]
MAYTDYQFYTTKYFGDAVTEEEFPKYAERASERVDSITFDRLADGLPEDVRANTKVQKAVCAVAEALHQIDSIRKASMDTVGVVKHEDGTVSKKQVASITSGAESVSFVTGTSGTADSIYARASMDKKVEALLIRQVASEYLQGVADKKGVCLLYAGI